MHLQKLLSFCICFLLNNVFALHLPDVAPETLSQLSKRQTTDPCAGLNTQLLIKYSDAVACLDSFPLSDAVRKQLLATLSTYFQLYPYFDVVKKSPESTFPSSLDIAARIDEISKKSYKTERKFHDDITQLYVDLRDAHSSYSNCYAGFTWTQPWSIIAEYPNSVSKTSTDDSQKPTLRIDSLVTSNYLTRARPLTVGNFVPAFRTALGFDPAVYIGATILEIENQPAVSFLSSAAVNSSAAVVKDDSARFNSMLSSTIWYYGKFLLGDGTLARQNTVPTTPSRSYKLQFSNGTTTTVDVPWLMVNPVSATSPVTFRNRQEFYELFCLRNEVQPGSYLVQNATSQANSARNFRHENEIFKREAENVKNTMQVAARFSSEMSHEGWNPPPTDPENIDPSLLLGRVNSIQEKVNSSSNKYDFTKILPNGKLAIVNTSPVLVNNNTAFYVLDDKKTGVWVLPTFSPKGKRLTDGTNVPITNDETLEWLESIATGFALLQRQGYTNLIIDVSQNGGGIVCFTYFAMRLLFSDIQFPAFDMRRSDLLVAIATAAQTATAGFYDANSKFALPTKQAFKRNSVDWTSARTSPPGYLGSYTQQYVDDGCADIVPSLISASIQSGVRIDFWKPTNIAILSEGSCGSACSMITRALFQQKGVRTYVYGGPIDVPSGRPFAWCSFDGGPVAKEPQIRSEIARLSSRLPAGNVDATPGSAASWANLVAPNTIDSLPIAVNWTMPVSATYVIKNLNKMVEWTYEPATDLINIGHSFEDRPALWREVLARMTGPPPSIRNNNTSSGNGSGSKSGAVSKFKDFGLLFAFIWVLSAHVFIY
ncbi:hypothetical protein HK098_005158 [Nowakowskiella sp. JEL0407]|nr:hypothetical protein HK098_005158 [Nowakowskiella sp. JEL0407]